MTGYGTYGTGLYNSTITGCCWNRQDFRCTGCIFRHYAGIVGCVSLPNVALTSHCISFPFIKSATDGSIAISAEKQHCCNRQKIPIFCHRSVPPGNDGRIGNAWITVTAGSSVPMAESCSSLEKPGNDVLQKFSQSKTKGE